MKTLRRALALLLLAVAVYAGYVAGRHRGAGKTAGGPSSPPPVSPAPGEVPSFSEIVRRTGPAVVNISTVTLLEDSTAPEGSFFDNPFLRDFFGFPHPNRPDTRRRREQSLGSGVIVSPEGLIMTNNHVVEGAAEITVTLSDRNEYPATVVGTDPKTDLAVLRIDGGKALPTLAWGDSDRIEVGEFVLAIGSPFGLARTVTLGIISAKGRANVGIADYEDFIQTDAAINPGNSGGPLVNTRGEMIGINTAIFSQSGGYQGIGFAVPSNMARGILDQLLESGRVSRGWLGVTIQDLSADMAHHFGLSDVRGALIGDIMEDSPAAEAGLRRGDIILRFAGRPVRDVAALRNAVATTKPGSRVEIEVWRDNGRQRLKATVSERPGETRPGERAGRERPAPARGLPLGLRVADLTREIRRQLGIAPGEKGVVVVKVRPGSAAEAAGLRRGDVIQELNRRPVESVRAFEQAAAEAEGPSLLLYVNRNGRRSFVTLSRN